MPSYNILALCTSCFLLAILYRSSWAYSTGAPIAACRNITPKHGHAANDTPTPYLVEVSKTRYSPNEPIYVRLRACGQAKFKGFMIQPRSALYPDTAAFLGAFLRAQGTKYQCVRSGAVLTHDNDQEKQSVTLTWIAPPAAAGHVVFRVTFVQAFTNFWVGINSPVISDGVSPDLTPLQLYSLQSPTDQSCDPSKTTKRPSTTTPEYTTTPTTTKSTTSTASTTTTTVPITTRPTTASTTSTTTTPKPTTTTTTTTSTTTIPTTTTTKTTTTTTKTTTTTTIPIPTTTTRMPSTTEASTEITTAPDYFYPFESTTYTDYVQPTSPVVDSTTQVQTTLPPTTTSVETTTTRTTTTSKTTTTTTTTINPTTTTTIPPPPTTTYIEATTTMYQEPLSTTDVKQESTTPWDFYPEFYPSTEVSVLTEKQLTTKKSIPILTFPRPTQPVIVNAGTTADVYIPTTTFYISTTTTRTTTTASTTTMPTTLPTTTKLTTTTNKPTPTTTTTRQPTTSKQTPQDTTTTARTSKKTTAATTTTAQEVLLDLSPDPACGVSQGCFDDCKGGLCSFMVSWKSESGSTTFNIRTKPESLGDYWIAVGFSEDDMMGLDSVTECVAEQNGVKVYQSYNLDYYRNVRLPNPKLGLSDTYGTMKNGIFHCIFSRRNYLDGEKEISDLRLPWYLMFAQGSAINGQKIPHRYDVMPPVTSSKVNLRQYPPVYIRYDREMAEKRRAEEMIQRSRHVGEKHTEQTRLISPDENCGHMQSCFQDCTPDGCRFIVSWVANSNHVSFKMRAVLEDFSDQWVAIAFSDDDKMGNDSVVECVAQGDEDIVVRHSFNVGKNNFRVKEPQIGLSNTSATFIDGVFECSFVRDRILKDESRIFNLDKMWRMFFAYGKSNKGTLLPHSLAEKDRPHVSDNLVDFLLTSTSLITADTMFIKFHACFMIFAWVFCASIATVVGRYFQPYWWGDKMIGSKRWIQVHWLFVILACMSVMISFVVIFIGVNGISKLFEITNKGFSESHPVMGLIVTLMALLHPLILLLRPSDGSTSRTCHSVIYFLVEIGGHTLSIVTIYAGFLLVKRMIPTYLNYVLVGFAGYQVLVLLVMEGLKYRDSRKAVEMKKLYLYEMHIRPWSPRSNSNVAAVLGISHSSKGMRKAIISVHFLILIAVTAVLVFVIWMS